MDTTGFNQIGRYGTLSLLKKRTLAAAQGNELVTSFGIDSNDLTFGSSSTCGVRLYYPDVDAVHCKIMFEDRKAFLVIYGSEGVYIDDSWVYPEGSSNSEQPQAIVPLSNDSEFEIHNKRFRFTYPPKEARATIMATPAPVSKRTLRLSMIHSAQVFSPRPSQDPRENLKVLQSPLKGIFGVKTPMRPGQTPTRRRAVSPLKYGVSRPDSDEDSDEEKGPDESKEKAIESSDESEDGNDDEEQIILVETNHPRVVEEERDLVILEQVAASNAPPPPPSPARALQQVKSIPQSPVQNPAAAPPQTPRRKSMSGTALHRAVLIRSAQRAVWRAEKEREDEEEEMEVLGAVEVDEEEDDDEDQFSDEEDNDVEMRSASSEEVSDPEMEEEEQDPKTVAEQKSLWRKSIERIIPWTFSGSPAKQDDEAEEEDVEVAEEPEASQELQDEEEAEEDDEANNDHADEGVQDDDEEQEEEEIAPFPAQTPIRRILGSFMTPQPQPQDAAAKRSNIFPQTVARPSMAAPPSSATAAGPGRLSLGGGEARRVMVQQPWKVKDLVVPPIATTSRGTPGPGLSSTTASPVRRPTEALPTTPMRGPATSTTATAPRATPAVTEEERRAIQERRRSAVREFKDDGFWKDGAPGMSPAKSSVRGGAGDRRSLSTSPVKLGGMGPSMGAGMTLDRPSSPTKGRSLGYAIAEEEDDSMSYYEPKASILAAVVAKQPSRNRSKSSDRGERDDNEDDEAEDKEDTQILLERMRETVEDMKRRRSIVQTPRAGGTPMTAAAPGSVLPSLPIRTPHSFAAGAGISAAPQVPSSVALATPHHRPSDGGVGVPFRMGSVKKIDFSHITPAAASMHREKSPVRPLENMADVASTSAVQPEMEMEIEKDDDEPFSLLRPAARDLRTPLASTRKPRSKDALLPRAEAAREQAVPTNEEPFLADIPSDEEIEVPKPKSRGRPRVPQTPKAPEVPAEEQTEEAEPARTESKPTKPAPKPRSRAAKSPAPEVIAESSTFAAPVRRGRSKTPQPVQVEEDVEELEQPKRSIPGKRTRRGTAEPEETLAPPATRRGRSKTPQSAHVEEGAEEEAPEPPKRAATTSRARRGTAEPEERVAAAAPARRGRKPTVEPEDVEVPEPEPKESKTPAVKRGRKPKVVPTVVEDEEEAEEEAPAPVVAPAKRSRSRKPVATADNHDDTDSAQPVASGSKTKSSIPVKAAVKGRKKAVAEQQEDVEEDDEPAPLARGRGVKSNIAPPKASTVTKTPAAATTAASKLAKPRGRPKTPASAPAATSRAASSSTLAVGKSEKENTPGDGSNSVSDETEEQPVKVRVSRKTTAAATTTTAKSSRIATKSATKTTATKSASKTKAKVDGDGEQEDEAAAAPSKPRATRIMRARTKTG